MASSDRSTALPYTPSNPPAQGAKDLSRATWDELYRIAGSLSALQEPSALSASCSELVAVQAATAWDRLFNEGVTYSWQNPGGTLDITTGVWTCPQEGLYSITVTAEAAPFPSPAIKSYTISLRTTLQPFGGGAAVSNTSQSGGLDDVSLQVFSTYLIPLYRGDTLVVDVDLTHATKTGNIQVKGGLRIVREGRIK